mgnify:CR=1 FL=1
MAKDRTNKSLYEWGKQAVRDLEEAAANKSQVHLVNENAFEEAAARIAKSNKSNANKIAEEIRQIAIQIKDICEEINTLEDDSSDLESIQRGIKEVKALIDRVLIQSGSELNRDQAPRIEVLPKS